ncbi:hypothetical protein UFOVP337_3 [uncultured Caudovirales phage]|uniref:Major capsid protein n=1 Tax=uncultured Caudovirales phage TaxID=2100421 RepID=A0A6J5LWQ4_9CAUD|nr:hypothetical protein UFOVP337_3 [uncultured Caudovirales phage]
MAGVDYAKVNENLVRAELWSAELKDVLQEQLMGTRYVRMLNGFPDGNQFTIPSVGELPMRETAELTPVVYDAMDTGEFNFTIDRYVESATFITDKAKQDSYYAQQLIGMFPTKMRRALDENLETSVFSLANTQTLNNANSINGAPHRFIASGSSNTVLSLDDFAKAKFALDKAQAGGTRVAIIDPSQEYVFNQLVGAQAFINNPQFGGIVNGGFVNEVTGMRFVKNIFGFDVYVSNFLATPTDTAINADGRGSVSTPAAPVTNVFMSVGGDLTPFVGAYRQMPRVEYERNKDLRRDEYVMNARFGLKLYRPECLVSVISKSTI